jgi:hypothetical protein
MPHAWGTARRHHAAPLPKKALIRDPVSQIARPDERL